MLQNVRICILNLAQKRPVFLRQSAADSLYPTAKISIPKRTRDSVTVENYFNQIRRAEADLKEEAFKSALVSPKSSMDREPPIKRETSFCRLEIGHDEAYAGTPYKNQS